MRCEFCDAPLGDLEPENVALLRHVSARQACKERFEFMLENLRASWTLSMSGG